MSQQDYRCRTRKLVSSSNVSVSFFPKSYLDFLRFANGGGLKLASFPFYEREGTAVDVFYKLTADESDKYGVIYNTLFLREVLYYIEVETQLVAVAADGGDNLIFMECIPESNAMYILYRTELASIVPVADTFEDFIDSLYLNPDLLS